MEKRETELSRDVEAVKIPSEENTRLIAGTKVVITQDFGGNLIVSVGSDLARIDVKDADAVNIDHEAERKSVMADPAFIEAIKNEGMMAALKATCILPNDPYDLLVSCSGPQRISHFLTVLAHQLPRKLRHRFNIVKSTIAHSEGNSGLYKRLNNRTLREILADDSLSKIGNVVASGYRDDISFTLHDDRDT